MLNLFTSITLIIILQSCAANDSIFELRANQSMLMTGKGPGQDAAINPYLTTKSIAIVKSLESNPVDVRVQYQGSIIEIVEIQAKAKQEFVLEKGYELYLNSDGPTKARVTFKKY